MQEYVKAVVTVSSKSVIICRKWFVFLSVQIYVSLLCTTAHFT